MSGKVFVNALALYWIAAMYFPENVSLYQFFLTGTTVLMVYSFGDYLYRFCTYFTRCLPITDYETARRYPSFIRIPTGLNAGTEANT